MEFRFSQSARTKIRRLMFKIVDAEHPEQVVGFYEANSEREALEHMAREQYQMTWLELLDASKNEAELTGNNSVKPAWVAIEVEPSEKALYATQSAVRDFAVAQKKRER